MANALVQVVMLTGLAGDEVDIVAGDVCLCSSDQANRFLAYGYAREFTDKDEGRRVKRLPEPAVEPDPEPNNSKPNAELLLLLDVAGIEQKHLDSLQAAGLDTIEKVAAASESELTKLKYLGKKTVGRILAFLSEGTESEVTPNDTDGSDEPDQEGSTSQEADEGSTEPVGGDPGKEA